MGLTFKINRPTGQYRSFDHITIDIKVDKEKVGYIGWKKYMDEGKKNGMRVHLYVHAPSERCGWRNVTLSQAFDGGTDTSEGNAAKEWVKANWDTIKEKYQLHPLTD